MKADNPVLSCDVCGRGAGGGLDDGRFSYCSSCRRFACGTCWVPGKDICRACLLPGRFADPRPQARNSETEVPASPITLTTGCERCGVATMMEEGSTEFCLACGLLVCAACWRAPDHRCASCAVLHQPPSRRGELEVVRRWDRRVREVIRGVALLETGATTADPSIELRREHASLVLKSDGAERAGRVAMARLSPASRTLRDTLLFRRIRRHELLAHDSLERVSATIPRLDAGGGRMAPDAQSAKSPVSAGEWLLIGRVLMVALSVVAIVILAQGWLGQLSFSGARDGEGVLGGVPTGGSADEVTNIDRTHAASPSPAAPLASPSTLRFDFDTVRMGNGIGEGWVRSNGSEVGVAVAAYPTAVDRSVRLVVTENGSPETCRTVNPPMAEVRRFSVEVILDPKVPAGAMIELRDAAGEPLLTLDLGEAQVVLSRNGGESVTMAEGLRPGGWYGIEVVGDRVAKWRVRPLDDPSGSGVEMPVEWSSLDAVGEICLGADGPLDSALNYNNLVMRNE